MRAKGSVFDEKISGCEIGFKFLDELDFIFLLNIGDGVGDKIPANVYFR